MLSTDSQTSSVSPDDQASELDLRSPGRKRWRKLLASEPLLLTVVLILMSTYISVNAPNFGTQSNLVVVLQNVAVGGIIMVPATFILISGNVDLSIGGIATVSALSFAWSAQHLSPGLAFIVPLVVGLTIGAVNAVLVTVVRINSLIATLAMFIILPAIALLGPTSIRLEGFLTLGTGRVMGLPFSVLIFVGTLGIGVLFLNHSRFGKHTFAVGANSEAARLSGIRPNRVVAILFVVSGLSAGLAGVVQTAEIGQANPYGNQLLIFSVLTAVVLGGSGLEGGRGSIYGAFVGLLILGVIDNGLVLVDAPSQYGQILRGAILLAAVGFSGYRRGKQS